MKFRKVDTPLRKNFIYENELIDSIPLTRNSICKAEMEHNGKFGHTFVRIQTLSIPKCPPRSHSLVCIENRLLIVGIGPILNKEFKFIFRSDRSDITCVYS